MPFVAFSTVKNAEKSGLSRLKKQDFDNKSTNIMRRSDGIYAEIKGFGQKRENELF